MYIGLKIAFVMKCEDPSLEWGRGRKSHTSLVTISILITRPYFLSFTLKRPDIRFTSNVIALLATCLKAPNRPIK